MDARLRKKILRRVSSAALKFWKDTAGRSLRSSAKPYKKALKRTRLTSRQAVLSLTGEQGPLPFIVELGYQTPDQGKYLLRSRKAKVSKDGRRYIDIYADGIGREKGRFLRYSERSKPWPIKVRARNFSDRVVKAIPTYVEDAVRDVLG